MDWIHLAQQWVSNNEYDNKDSVSIKGEGMSWIDKRLLAFQEPRSTGTANISDSVKEQALATIRTGKGWTVKDGKT
jgi:hypothetical protein